MSFALTILFAVAGGVAVGNLYWSQPLLGDIAGSLRVSAGTSALLVTVTQLGYAFGVLTIVPLGDTADRRRLIPMVMFGSAVALFMAALAPSFAVLLVALVGVGLTTISGQLLTPLAGDLARDEQRGRVVGTIVSGLLIGILLSRTVSGLVAGVFGWRVIYVLAAGMTISMAGILAWVLPVLPKRPAVAYRTLVMSVFTTVGAHRAAQATLALGACVFAVFTLFWTALTFLLSAQPFGYSVQTIGLVGLVGVAGALAARRAGSLHDRGWSVRATGAAITLAGLALILAAVGSQSIVTVLLAVLLLDVAIQAVNVLNQTRMLSLQPSARSRLNTAFVTANFIGGAFGSSLAGVLWRAGGWQRVMLGGLALLFIAMLVWLSQRRVLGGRTTSADNHGSESES